MTQAYSNPTRESDPYALPDVEVFWNEQGAFPGPEGEPLEEGWYYWLCFPGCLPNGDPVGPFASEDEAIEDMRENWGDWDEED